MSEGSTSAEGSSAPRCRRRCAAHIAAHHSPPGCLHTLQVLMSAVVGEAWGSVQQVEVTGTLGLTPPPVAHAATSPTLHGRVSKVPAPS